MESNIKGHKETGSHESQIQINALREFTSYLKTSIPRVLTHLDRDEDSPTFGCFDRDFWHYKMRDFASAVLQQSCTVLGAIPLIADFPAHIAQRWLKGSLQYWSQLPTKNGGMNEYYPYESSYPATAFSLEAVTRILIDRRDEISPDVSAQIKRGVDYLSNHFEAKASNQQAAGIAALANAQRLGITVHADKFQRIRDRFFESQSEEGWFPEYGGPDIGYLSVTIDMLFDYYDASGDERAMNAMKRAVTFLRYFVCADGTLLTAANTRHTDYIVPYGLVRLAEFFPDALDIFQRVFSRCNEPDHFLQSIDDRYHLHYVFNSCARAFKHLGPMQCPEIPMDDLERYFNQSQICIRKSRANAFVFAGQLGGAVQVHGKSSWEDYGWRCKRSNKIWVSNMHTGSWRARYKNGLLEVSGYMVAARWPMTSPIKAVCIRILSIFFGKKLARYAKKHMIFIKPNKHFYFERTVDLKRNLLKTKISSRGRFTAYRAAKHPIRHVASAYSFSPLDAHQPTEERREYQNVLEVEEGIEL